MTSNKESSLPNAHTSYLVLWIAGFWALNPVQTNAVTYLVQRMASMHAMFYVLSIAMYIRGRRCHLLLHQRSKGTLCYFACAFSAVGAFLSKEISAMLPIMLLTTEIWFFQPDLLSRVWRRIRRAHLGLWLLLGAGSVVSGVCFVRLFVKYTAGYASRDFTLWERLLTESRVVVWYMSLLLYPSPSRMSLEHDVAISTSIVQPLSTLFCILLIAFMLWQTLRLRKRYPLITYGSIWFFLNLAIESTFLPLELVFEHRLYLSAVGFSISLVLIMHSLLRRLLQKYPEKEFKSLLQSGLAIVLSVFALLTFARNETWKSEVSIEMDNMEKAPLSPRAHVNLAVAYYRAADYSKCIDEAKEAIRLGHAGYERYGVAANAIVSAYLAMKNPQMAIEEGEHLMINLPGKIDGAGVPEFFLNVAHTYLKSGQQQKAYLVAMMSWDYLKRIELTGFEYQMKADDVLKNLRAIVASAREEAVDLNGDGQIDPGELTDNTWIAKELLSRGEHQWTKTLLARAVTAGSSDTEGQLLLEELEMQDAQTQRHLRRWNFFQNYFIHPSSKFNVAMAIAFITCEKKLPYPFSTLGEGLLNYALSVRPDSSDAHLLKGWYHFQKNENSAAIEEAKRAIQIEPDYAKAWLGLGFFLEKANQPGDAIAAFQKLLDLYPGYSERNAILMLLPELEKRQSPNGMVSNKFERKASQSASFPKSS